MIPLYVPKTGGLSTTKAAIVRWFKREGEPVQKGEPLVELMTEKVTYVLEAPASGVLLKILASEEDEVPVGDVLAYIGGAEEVG
mgnify:CR=1 FL=1